ncbi:hypothetical protein NIES2101_28440 [Calothrix sp. HK-06]|nr:hypothetical protein NIES2101_28440 [Calothrix sp. HK-06]
MTFLANTSLNLSPNIFGYSLVEKIYLGSRTAVYRAIQVESQRPVVIKVLRREYPSFAELVQFRNQYTIMRYITDANDKNCLVSGIVQPLSLEPMGNSYALVMEDCGGVALGKYVQQHSLSLTEVFAIAIQIADILHNLCQHRVVHKDLKPANILIHPESKQVKLIDFSIASLLPKETQEIQSPNILEGTLAYLAPEQTGRMNRGIDYRADFYALGVTLYQLLSGTLPFAVDDPLELMHCHIAKAPVPVNQVNPDVPTMVAKIVAKLMAKNAEDRYQSALGLKYDLQQCLTQWKETGKITAFELGQRDLSDRFLIPEKLYGREAEVQALLKAFDRVASGTSELMLVAGFSGIGKTAVVSEIHKPIVRQRGYFIKGKFDQFNRNIPLSAFVQALRDLMGQLLCESDEQVAQWRTQILAVVGENGQVLINLIPEVEQIIGKQPSVAELSGNAAQNRFNLLFQKFIKVFTTAEHPLVIFLDDLQWADLASLQLLKLLMSDNGYLLMLGAYRDNEVSPTHPFILTVEELKKSQAIVHTISLAPLNFDDTNYLVADTLKCSRQLAQPLTELIDRRTKGNPFFTTQFLKALHEDGQISFDHERRYWKCNIAQVKALTLTDDVVEFMALQLQKLPLETQQVLKLAACVGNQFDLATLAIVFEQSQITTANALWRALQEGLILPTSQVYKFFQGTEQSGAEDKVNLTYRFLHDRVQQAAYSLIPEHQKKAAHLKIGKLLLNNTSHEFVETNIFEIVNQLNKGIDTINQQSEKYKVAQLNLIAGRKAKSSTAYQAAVKHFRLGTDLLTGNSWQIDYSLTFGLYRERAECEYLTGDLNQAEKLFELVLNYAQDKFAQADIYAIQMYLKMTQGENIQAGLKAGLKGLSIMGMHLPLTVEEQQAAIKAELEKLNTLLKKVQPADLFNLPEMTDAIKKVCMSLLADIWAAAYMAGEQYLSFLSILLMVNNSLLHGNAEASGFAYCLYGMSLVNQGDYQTAYEFGTLGLKLDRHYNSTKFIYKTNNIFAHTINPYNQHLKTNLPLSRQSFQTSREAGDVVFGVWAVSFLIWAMLVKGDRLDDVYAETEKYLSYVQQVNDINMLYAFTLQRQFLLSLQNSSQYTDLLVSRHKNIQNDQKTLYIDVWRHKKNFEHGINWYCFLKLQLAYFYGRYADAIEAAEEAEETLAANAGFFPIIQYYFYYPLSLIALYPTATSETKKQYCEVLQQHQSIIKQWADSCPENFLHRYLLLSAEMAQISGRNIEAADLYDRAIATAKANEYIHEEALANELAAKFYLSWGKERIAQEYMTEAYYGYARWGAKAKVQDLESRYPNLLALILQQQQMPLSATETYFATEFLTVFQTSVTQSSSSGSTSISTILDLASVLKASQTLSSEIQLDKLLATLLHTVLENAGADKGVLLMPHDNQWFVEAFATVDQLARVQSIALSTSQEIPHGLINSVKRSLQPLVIVDAAAHPTLATDAYVLQKQPKSMLCTPILRQGKLVAILYLENHLTVGAFTRDRVELLNLLCTQAAISLENARLYQQAQTYAQKLEQSQLQIVQSEKMASLGNLVAGVAHEINNPIGFLNGSINNAKEYVQDVLEHLALYQQHYPNPAAPIEDNAQEIDLEFLSGDLPKLLDSMKSTTERIKSISTSLRTFSRADTDNKVGANLHEGLDSTLLILKYRLKGNEHRPAIEIIQNYGNLPEIECFPGQLNQVFMNILANAIDVFDEAAQQASYAVLQTNPQKITIKTALTEQNAVEIQISDNGKGMSSAVKARIFDHLFTTKGVGKGTGLGLAIARQIVDKHGGSLEVQSELDRGTDFYIRLPL